MIAGPSEILVICDGKTDPDWIAMDLFSQAEHDEDAQSILVSPDEEFLGRVQSSIAKLLPQMERREIIQASLQSRGVMIKVGDMDEAVKVANYIAPEHLELSIDNTDKKTKRIRPSGAIFNGSYKSEDQGGYSLGENHALPS